MLALLLIPILLALSAMFMYRFSGKREILQLDLVQFLFTFVVYPIGYIWLKNFIYILLRDEVGVLVSLGQWVTIDTIFTVLFLYFYAFGTIHAVTKTFSLNLNRDPLYDMLHDAKYFHEFLSHVGLYIQLVTIPTILAIINGFFPFNIVNNKVAMDMVVLLGWFSGFLAYIGFFHFTDKGYQYLKYKRIMKLTIAVCFLANAFFYFFFRPKFSLEYGAYWIIFIALTSTITSMFFFSPSRRFGKFLERLPIKGID